MKVGWEIVLDYMSKYILANLQCELLLLHTDHVINLFLVLDQMCPCYLLVGLTSFLGNTVDLVQERALQTFVGANRFIGLN